LFAAPAGALDGVEPGIQVRPRTSEPPRPAGRDERLCQRLAAIDIDDTTPRQALELLASLKKLAEA
jgi:hypothetical protein